MKRRLLALAFALPVVLAMSGHAWASYPERPVRVVVPVPPGGIIDQVVRIITPVMAETMKQPIVVENRPGASGNIAATGVARSPADGYTLLAGYSMFHVGNPVMYKSLSWDPLKDFTGAAMFVASPHVVAVNPSLPINNLKELVEYAKKNPGKLDYATSGNGSVPHIGMELFKQRNGIYVVHVPYRGAGPAVQDVLAGRVAMTIATPPSLAAFVTTNRLRPLAVAAKSRIPMLPDVPTSAEAGFPGFELDAWVALFAPAGTPKEIVAVINDAANKAMQQPKVREALLNIGVSPWAMTPAELDQQVRRDIDYWQPVIRKANISID